MPPSRYTAFGPATIPTIEEPVLEANHELKDVPFTGGGKANGEKTLTVDPALNTVSGSPEATGPDDSPSEKGQRGRGKRRPKMQSGGETPNNKRKTQVRLAQRAYRARKDATIASLNDRIYQLEGLVEQMSRTFLSLSGELVKSGVLASTPDLARTLQQSTKHYLSLTNQAVSVVDNGPGDTATDSSFLPSDSTLPASDASPVAEGKGNLNNSILPADYSLPPSLDCPTAITSQSGEAGFAYRLHRACVEVAYRCLTDPDSRPQTIYQRLGLPLGIVTPQRLTFLFESFLRNGFFAHSGDLEVPFFGIGGAGSHYIDYRRDYITANTIREQSSTNVATNHQSTYEMRDVWLDCYDVEGYLKENGIVPVGVSKHSVNTHPHLHSRNDNNDELQNGRHFFASTHNKAQQYGSTTKLLEERALIQMLTGCCICLGRAPGFRRVEVERFVMELGNIC
ncbi:hypothetical protein AWENTII_012028 [Aspergillus wentii]